MNSQNASRRYQRPSLTKAGNLNKIVAIASGPVPSDIRLKRDIERISTRPDGIGVYSYRYIVGEARFIGAMAQDVQAVRPDAVTANADGFLAVDYARLGMALSLDRRH